MNKKKLKQLRELKEKLNQGLVALKDGLKEGETFTPDQIKSWDDQSAQLKDVESQIATHERLLSLNPGQSPEGGNGNGNGQRFTPPVATNRQTANAADALRGWALSQVNRPDFITDQMREAQGETQWDGPLNGMIYWDQKANDLVTGGHSINDAIVAGVIKKMKSFGGMLEACRVFVTSDGAPLKKMVRDSTNFKAQKTAEMANAVNTTQNMDKVTFGETELTSAIFEISLKLIRDSAYDVLGDFNDAIGESFARGANTLLTLGALADEPQGIQGAVTAIAPAALSFGTIIDLYHSVDEAYRLSPKCGWMMNDNTVKRFKKTLVDADGRPMYKSEPNLVGGFRYVIEDKPVFVNSDLADNNVLFGDFSKYEIRLVGGVNLTVLRELYALRRAIGIVGHTGIDGRLVDNTAIKKIVLI